MTTPPTEGTLTIESPVERNEGTFLMTSPEEMYLLGGEKLEGKKDVGPEFAKGDESLEKLSEFTGEAETRTLVEGICAFTDDLTF